MKTIFRIAKTELRTLFYSPIAWFLMIVFLIQCGIVYLGQLNGQARIQDLGGMGMMFMDTLTQRVYLSQGGLFASVMQNLYLYIPLLTMSLISRETSSGTIKLLYSSPIKVREIVFGKYLAMMIYSLILVAIVSIFVISGLFQIQNPETGMLMTALLGFYLLLLAYSAIGLFMSTLTTYQVVAAICTFVMIGILSYIGTLWQRIAFVRELTYFLSINGRTGKMLSGLVTTKDLIYFFVIIYMFLGFSIYKLKGGMESKPAMVKAARYVVIVVSALLIGYVSSIPGFIGYYDATFNKVRTITPRVQGVLADLGDEPLEVTAYVNLVDQFSYLGDPESYNQTIGRWEPYMRFKPNIKLKQVNYYDSAIGSPWLYQGYPGKNLKEIAEQYAKNNDVKLKDYLTPEQIRKMINVRDEDNRYVMQLKWKGRTTWLRVFNDMMVWPSETEVAAALRRLQKAKLPKIGFITGDLERDINKMGDRDYKTLTNLPSFRNSLVNQGFDVENVDLEAAAIPQDLAALVLADPKIELTANTKARLTEYINNGGNILIAGEPGKQAILNPLLKELGVQIMEGTLIQESKDNAPNQVRPGLTQAAGTFTKSLAKSVADSLPVSMPGAAGLSWTDGGAFAIQPLLLTDPKTSWNRIKPLDPDMMSARSEGAMMSGGGGMMVSAVSMDSDRGVEEEAVDTTAKKETKKEKSKGAAKTITLAIAPGKAKVQPAEVKTVSSGDLQEVSSDRPSRNRRENMGVVTFSAADGDTRGAIPAAVSLTRKINGKEQRIVVAGDADFISNKELGRWGTSNFVFSTAIFSWLSGGEFPIDTSRPEARDKRVNVTMDDVDYLRIIYVWVLPAILLAFGAILLIRRKRK